MVQSSMIYAQLTRFLWPLLLTSLVYDLGAPIVNGGMARVPRPTETLAAFGLAWGLTSLLASPLGQIRQVGLVLADSRRNIKTIQSFVFVSGLLLAGMLALLALTPIGHWVIDELHGLEPSLGDVVRQGLFWLMPIPLLQGLSRLYSGLLLRIRRTELIIYATLASIGSSITAVFILLPTEFVHVQPIRLPILVTYAGVLVDLAVLFWGYRRYAMPRFEESSGAVLAMSYVARFFWPLALIMAIQGVSRPIINLFVSRGPNGEEALAVLAVVYALAHVPYGWLNELRSLPPAFKTEDDRLRNVRRFIGGCGLLSFSIMALLFWTPLSQPILKNLIGLDDQLAVLCGPPLIIFAFFPLAVTVRSYLHGVALVEHRTRALAPSGPSRILAICIVMLTLPITGMHGATLGVTALLCGFIAEALVVWWGVHGRNRGRLSIAGRGSGISSDGDERS